jgi:hypothetical protein
MVGKPSNQSYSSILGDIIQIFIVVGLLKCICVLILNMNTVCVSDLQKAP